MIYGTLCALLFCANMKFAKIQCKSQTNRQLSSHVTLDDHCCHWKVASWCYPTFDMVSQACACVHAHAQDPIGLSSMLAVKLHTLNWAFFNRSLAAHQEVWYFFEYTCLALHVVKPSESDCASCPNALEIKFLTKDIQYFIILCAMLIIGLQLPSGTTISIENIWNICMSSCRKQN